MLHVFPPPSPFLRSTDAQGKAAARLALRNTEAREGAKRLAVVAGLLRAQDLEDAVARQAAALNKAGSDAMDEDEDGEGAGAKGTPSTPLPLSTLVTLDARNQLMRTIGTAVPPYDLEVSLLARIGRAPGPATEHCAVLCVLPRSHLTLPSHFPLPSNLPLSFPTAEQRPSRAGGALEHGAPHVRHAPGPPRPPHVPQERVSQG